MPVVADVPVEADPANTSNTILTLDDVGESAVLCAVYMLWKVNFPSQAIVKSQFRCDAPAIFSVVEHAGCLSAALVLVLTYRLTLLTSPKRKLAKAKPPAAAVRSIAIGEVVYAVRFESLGTRRFSA